MDEAHNFTIECKENEFFHFSTSVSFIKIAATFKIIKNSTAF
jgi:hypothetical protein